MCVGTNNIAIHGGFSDYHCACCTPTAMIDSGGLEAELQWRTLPFSREYHLYSTKQVKYHCFWVCYSIISSSKEIEVWTAYRQVDMLFLCRSQFGKNYQYSFFFFCFWGFLPFMPKIAIQRSTSP